MRPSLFLYHFLSFLIRADHLAPLGAEQQPPTYNSTPTATPSTASGRAMGTPSPRLVCLMP